MRNLFAALIIQLVLAGDGFGQLASTANVLDVAKGYQLAKSISVEPSKFAVDESAVTIVFIPGILGSKLTWENYTYGTGAVDPKRLVYRIGNAPKVSTLDTFEVSTVSGLQKLLRQDVYGTSLEQLKDINYGKLIEEFSYDWRVSIDESARALNTWLARPGLKGKRIVFIAHSMGGLVLWRWLQTTTLSSRPVSVRTAIIAGSPLQGSCDAARMLIENYGPPQGASGAESFGTYLLFGEAHAALLTFPSVFQLLPNFSPRRPCLSMQMPDRTFRAQNHHEPGFWFGTGREESTGLFANNRKRLKEYAEKVGMTPEKYEESVKSAIAAGEAFRRNLSLDPPLGVNLVLFYSSSRRMPDTYPISKNIGQGWFNIGNARTDRETEGDGRVLAQSAMNDGYGATPVVQRFQLSEQHGTLIKDPALVRYLRDNVVLAQREEYFIGLGKALAEAAVRSNLQTQNVIFDPGFAYTNNPELLDAQMRISNYNAETMAPGVKFKGDVLRAYAADLPKNSSASTAVVAAALWESSLFLDPDYASLKSISPLIRYRAENQQWSEINATAMRIEPLVESRLVANQNEAAAREVFKKAGIKPWKPLKF